VFYSKKGKRVQDGTERTTLVGTSLALWPNPDAPATRPVVRPSTEEPTLLFGANEPPWGSAAIAVGPWLYAYACEPAPPFDTPCKLARVTLERALDRSAWLFYARGSWSPDWHAATPVLDGNVSQMSVEWNNYLGKYVAISTRFFSTLTDVRTADRPEGPWSKLALLESRSVGPLNCFGVTSHPELAKGGGRTSILSCTCDGGLINGNQMRALEIEFRKR
jgi:hypothetical protein